MAIAALALAPATRRLRLAKPEWGTKRICQSCGARFYDFGRSPITCPACGAVFDLEILNRARRARPGSRAVVAAAGRHHRRPRPSSARRSRSTRSRRRSRPRRTRPVVETDDEAEEDDSLIEDASELGDDEDMSDVIEGGIDEEPR